MSIQVSDEFIAKKKRDKLGPNYIVKGSYKVPKVKDESTEIAIATASDMGELPTEKPTARGAGTGLGKRKKQPSGKPSKKTSYGKDSGKRYKWVTAPHRNVKGEKVLVEDRPGKPRKKKMVNPGRGFNTGGKLGINNAGQKLVQKLYSKGGKV